MKKIILLLFVLGMFQISTAQKANDKVKIKYEGKWYAGTVEKVNDATKEYYVSYEGWGDDMKELVKIDRIKLETKPAAAPKAATKAK